MPVYILEDLALVPADVWHGRVIILGKDNKEIVLCLEDVDTMEALAFTEQFSRKTGFFPRCEPMSFFAYTEYIQRKRESKAKEQPVQLDLRSHSLIE